MPNATAPEALEEPLSSTEIKRQIGNDGYLEGVVKIELSEVADCQDADEFLDQLVDRLIAEGEVTDVTYNLIGHNGNQLLIKIRAQVTDAADTPSEENV